jgi:DnaJ family protein C protein 27
VQVSAATGAGVKQLFTSLFARILATVPGMPEDLTALAVQQVGHEPT